MKAYEVNFDGLVGPTHNYAGLSFGNVASLSNAADFSNPKEAAKQGLAKMKALHDLGLKQAVLAPQERPDMAALRHLGFSGSDAQVLEKAAKTAPHILAACCSASSMWTANAATVSPSADTEDGRVHLTPANLANKFHRSLEHPTTERILKAIFRDESRFAVHSALPQGDHFGDEGAANHTRFCGDYGQPGVEFFVYGKQAFDASKPAPVRFPARQTLEASQAVARLHGLPESRVVFAQQNPNVIDQGVFHNDVIAVGNGNVHLFHEVAFLNKSEVLAELDHKFGGSLVNVEVKNSEVSVEDAVKSYLFNSQLVTLPSGRMAIIAPGECQENSRVWSFLQDLLTRDTPVKAVHIQDVKQSMRNGGGPACLRLRVALKEAELAAINPAVVMSDALFATLNTWVDKHYRDRLSLADLADPALLEECRQALDELTRILAMSSVYQFQR
ncbi:MAG: N-succinylarginine dihydrolase [Gammaproteobacteria bacterium]|nr:N-succinylarginine dihydrolase [Gammaproteobacteria bacterium]